MRSFKDRKGIFIISLLFFGVIVIALELTNLRLLKDAKQNQWLLDSVQQLAGGCLLLSLLGYLNIRLFDKPQNIVYIIPALLIAMNNFPFLSYFAGNMQFTSITLQNVLLFLIYCFSIAFFEELAFRGILFSALLEVFKNNKNKLLKTYIVSSIIFGFCHILNAFEGGIYATLRQILYSILTGGLFAYVLIKTKNILYCILIHGLYNFNGLLLSKQGLGTGVVFDVPTVIIMATIALIVGIFVLYSIVRCDTTEKEILYQRLGVKTRKK